MADAAPLPLPSRTRAAKTRRSGEGRSCRPPFPGLHSLLRSSFHKARNLERNRRLEKSRSKRYCSVWGEYSMQDDSFSAPAEGEPDIARANSASPSSTLPAPILAELGSEHALGLLFIRWLWKIGPPSLFYLFIVCAGMAHFGWTLLAAVKLLKLLSFLELFRIGALSIGKLHEERIASLEFTLKLLMWVNYAVLIVAVVLVADLVNRDGTEQFLRAFVPSEYFDYSTCIILVSVFPLLLTVFVNIQTAKALDRIGASAASRLHLRYQILVVDIPGLLTVLLVVAFAFLWPRYQPANDALSQRAQLEVFLSGALAFWIIGHNTMYSAFEIIDEQLVRLKR